MSFGFGFGFPKNYIATLFNPAQLFTGTTNGAWYDPSDINLTWRRNLLTYSERFDNAAWGKLRANITPNAIAAPDGTITAYKVVADTSTNTHGISQSTTTVAGTTYTQSFFAKSGEYRYVYISPAGPWSFQRFDLQTGTVGPLLANFLSASIVSVGNGWYRCSATWVSTAANNGNYIWIGNSTADAAFFAGDGTSGIYIWGAQLEIGSTATPYQRITDGIKDYLDYNPLPILYQDAAGTTPVTAVGQPVGLMLDKSKGLVLGPDIKPTSGSWVPEGSTVATSNSPTSVTFNTSPAGDVYASATPVAVSSNIEISYTVSGYISGGVSIQYGFGATKTYVAANGTYTKRVSALGDGALYVFCSAGTTATVTINSARIVSGNHAYNPSGNSANFPVLSARYNLLTKTEQFDDAVWTKTASLVTQNSGIAPNGTNTAGKLIENTSTASHELGHTISSLSAAIHTFAVFAKAGERTVLQITFSGNGGSAFANYDLNTGVLGTVGNSGVATITSVGNGWYKCTLASGSAFAAGSCNFVMMPQQSATASRFGAYTGDGTSGIYIWGADLRVTNDALNQPAYQRVNTATDYDTVGFKPYLAFNGVNQWLQTNSIDFTYGDKMFVSAGVRKLSDAGTGVIGEFGYGSNGYFVMFAPDSPNQYNVNSKGTVNAAAAVNSGYAAPITNVISGIGNISAPSATLRVNGTQAAQSTATQGTGNYGNYPLYIGARAGSSLWFNGRLYGLVVAGKQASASEIASTEAWLNNKTGAY